MRSGHIAFSFPSAFSYPCCSCLRRLQSAGLFPGRYARTVRACASGVPSPVIKPAASTVLIRYMAPDFDDEAAQVLLVKRGKAPNQHLWALPGGSVNPDESLLLAAMRELNEETGFPLSALTYLPQPFLHRYLPVTNANYSYHIHVFCAFTEDCTTCPVAGDDAVEARFVHIDQINTLEAVPLLYSTVREALRVLKTRPLDDSHRSI